MIVMRLRISIEGVVQGVGMRPFLHALATRLGLGGFVLNDGRGVTVEVEGDVDRVQQFVVELPRQPPPLAVIERVRTLEIPIRHETAFLIADSAAAVRRQTLVPPDTATCDDCVREIFDPADRRFRYPFTNCTNCGPRFTIVRDVPYDRARTTMASFTMCADCAREYHDPTDRRFHAEPIACPACGPRLRLAAADGSGIDGDAITQCARLLGEGRVVAIKGIGGYHLATDAGNHKAVAELRARKHREDKPFALMVRDLTAARALAEVDADEAALLTGRARPIVLLRRRPGDAVAPAVAPASALLGIMLPYTPVHHLLLADFSRPLVLTSGNVSDEPIAYRDDDARSRLRGIADAFLLHDREIDVRTDDSVTRSFRGLPLPVRRARGDVPRAIRVPRSFPQPILACGGELKSTVCLAHGDQALLSQHIGDLENAAAFAGFVEAIARVQRLLDVEPTIVAHDLHPEYLSTKWALDHGGPRIVGVQHHHAHIAACLADNGEVDAVIGVAFDGLGYGPDATLWGGEFLVADLARFERLGHLATVPMPGGAAAVREPWRMAAVYLDHAGVAARLPVAERHAERWPLVQKLMRARSHAPLTSSAGRLFDAVAALLDVRDTVTYEGQAAIELEQLADPAERESYPAAIDTASAPFTVRGADIVAAALQDRGRGVPRAAVAGRFHNAVADVIHRGCLLARARTGLSTVALSGGVFQNVLLLGKAIDRLEADGFRVLRHRHVPPNDGGLSLGQAVIAREATTR